MFRTICVLILCFVLYSGKLTAQETPSLVPYEDSLLILYHSVLEEQPLNKESASAYFYDKFCAMLEIEGSFSFPFARLENIGKVYSTDKRIRIYSWNIPFGADDNLYFGIVQYYSKTDKKYLLIKLNEPLNNPGKLKINAWQSTLYYEIVDTKHAGQKYYTLLGFNLHNSLSNIKRIDVVSIDESDQFYFCENLIQYNGKLVDKLEFQYNEKAVMSLRYNTDVKMIVFDHLSPQKPSLIDNFEFYGPDFTYDGLKFEKGIWIHYPNIDITN